MYTLQISTNTVWAAVQSLVRELRSHMLRGAIKKLKRKEKKNSLAVQQLRLCAATAEVAGSMSGQGTKISHAAWCSQKVKRKRKEKI